MLIYTENLKFKKLHDLELKIALEIKRICELNSINYFLIGGTLLGAVRHKGFIPWDDDMDIGMPRKDYEKFISIFQKETNSEMFFLQTWDTDTDFGMPFSKILLKGTQFKDPCAMRTKSLQCIFIDVFPFDAMAPNKIFGFCHYFLLRLFGRLMLYKKNYELLNAKRNNFFIEVLLKKIASFSNEEKLKKRINYISTFFENKKFKNRICLFGSYRYKEYINKIFPTSTVPFESEYFPIPNEYDKYLKNIYGNYMELPPIEKRGNRHGDINSDSVSFGPY